MLGAHLTRSRMPRLIAALAAGLSVLLIFILGAELSQGQEAGVTPPKDTIFARKILMGSIDMQMDEIEMMTVPEGTLNLAEGHEHADNISIMLLAFPHMFPASTNQWQPNADRDAATDTYASPDLWTNFAEFYQRAADASKIALDASKAKRADDFKALTSQLRAACNGCHALYQKTD
jgi:cytochrome c556